MAGETTNRFDRDAMARWYAQRHLKTDEAVQEVHYLPEGRPQTKFGSWK